MPLDFLIVYAAVREDCQEIRAARFPIPGRAAPRSGAVAWGRAKDQRYF